MDLDWLDAELNDLDLNGVNADINNLLGKMNTS
jgi:hypothetical protein